MSFRYILSYLASTTGSSRPKLHNKPDISRSLNVQGCPSGLIAACSPCLSRPSYPTVPGIALFDSERHIMLLDLRQVVGALRRELHRFSELRCHPLFIVLRHRLELLPGIDAIQLRGIEAEDLALSICRQLGIAVLFSEVFGNLESPQRVDLPLRRAVPNRIRTKNNTIRPHELHQLSHQMCRNSR